MTNLIKLFGLLLICSFASCEVSINSSDTCLECSYRKDGGLRTEKLCNDFGTEEDMDEMRDRMQMEADEEGVVLNCERS